jgi:5-methylthioadenosine/S-adenosylhomocysteine deaminase
MTALVRYHAKYVLPVTAPPIVDGTVCVDGERIAYVGPRSEAPSGEDVDLGEAVLVPGLVNVHTHLELTVMRGFLEDLAFRPWLVRLTSARRVVLSTADLRDSARLGIEEGLLAGITTYADATDSGESLEAMRDAGVRGIAYREVFGPDPKQLDESMRGLRAAVDRLRERETPLVRAGVSPHAPYTVSDALFQAVARYARDERLPIAVHNAESEAEHRYVHAAEGPFAEDHRARGIPVAPRAASPMRLLENVGVLEAKPLLIHCIRLEAEEIALVREHDCSVAHCPASNAKLGHGIAPVVEMMAAGVRVGLGSDSVASNNRMDLFDEARLAGLMQRARLGSPDQLPATRLMELATIAGARALGMDGEVGSLEAGKQADLAGFAVGGSIDALFDPAAALVFGIAGRVARLVMVNGRVLVRDGRLTEPSEDGRARVRVAAERLQDWLGAG